MNSRVRAYGLTIILVGLVLSPLVGAFADDSFPISTYPMFATARSSETNLTHVILTDANGNEWGAEPSAIANDEVLQVQETILQALRDGEAATAALCERVAGRVAGSGATTVQIVTSTFDAILYYDGDREPTERRVHATCETQP